MHEFQLERRIRRTVLILSVLAAAAAILVAIPVLAGPNLKPEKIHEIHLVAKVGLDCASCHTAAAKDSGVMSVPVKTAACAACHDNPKQLGFEERSPARRSILFSHAAHTEMGKTCVDCHKGAAAATVAKAGHPQCKECHKEDYDGTLCGKCHINFEAVGLKKLSEYKHANDFMSRHPEYARKSIKACAQCHNETYCSNCHSKHESIKPDLKFPEKVRANLIHRGDWGSVHQLEARTDSSSCLKCHTINTCNSCHTERGAGPKADKVSFQHPTGWMTKGSKDFHGDKARTDIVTCAACHNNGGPGNCRTCHKASAGRNPHPKNWSPSLSQSDKMCAECHSH